MHITKSSLLLSLIKVDHRKIFLHWIWQFLTFYSLNKQSPICQTLTMSSPSKILILKNLKTNQMMYGNKFQISIPVNNFLAIDNKLSVWNDTTNEVGSCEVSTRQYFKQLVCITTLAKLVKPCMPVLTFSDLNPPVEWQLLRGFRKQ